MIEPHCEKKKKNLVGYIDRFFPPSIHHEKAKKILTQGDSSLGVNIQKFIKRTGSNSTSTLHCTSFKKKKNSSFFHEASPAEPKLCNLGQRCDSLKYDF